MLPRSLLAGEKSIIREGCTSAARCVHAVYEDLLEGSIMKLLWIAVLTPLLGAAPSPDYPHWDGKESVADYAKRAKLEPTLSIDLGGVKWEGVLIPAGTFVIANTASASGSFETTSTRLG